MKRKTMWMMISVFTGMALIGMSIGERGSMQTALAAAPSAAGGWTHSGCGTPSSGGTCYDIYTDSSGQDSKCKPCGETKKPNNNTCTAISQAALNAGRWCS